MLIFSHNSFVDEELYEQHLRVRGFIYMDFYRMKSLLSQYRARQDTYRYLTVRAMRLGGTGEYSNIERETMFRFFMDDLYLDEKRFRNRKTAGYSLDSKQVLEPLKENLTGYAKEVCINYMEHNSLKSKNGRIEKLLKDLYLEEGLCSHDGEQLAKLNFLVNIQENRRYNYKQQDIISISNDYKSCNAAPEGYVLVWGDFAQSDWRIAYNLFVRDERNAKIMDETEDKYEGIARVLCDFYGENFNLAEFKQKRNIYKVYVLQTIYGQRADGNVDADAFIKRFTKYLGTCPRYMEFYEGLRKACTDGSAVEIISYFGYKQYVGGGLRLKEAVDKGLNTPVQTCTSEVVMLTVNETLARFEALGYDTTQDVSLYFTRHDEPIFIMKESVMKDSWVFDDCSTVLVDDWTPLKLTFNFGYRYGEVDDVLEAKYLLSSNSNKHRNTPAPSDCLHFNYNPIVKPMEMAVAACVGPNQEVIVDFLNLTEGTLRIEVLGHKDTISQDQLKDFMMQVVEDETTRWRAEGYGSVRVFSTFSTLSNSGMLRVIWMSDKQASYNKAFYFLQAFIAMRMGLRELETQYMIQEYVNYYKEMDMRNGIQVNYKSSTGTVLQ